MLLITRIRLGRLRVTTRNKWRDSNCFRETEQSKLQYISSYTSQPSSSWAKRAKWFGEGLSRSMYSRRKGRVSPQKWEIVFEIFYQIGIYVSCRERLYRVGKRCGKKENGTPKKDFIAVWNRVIRFMYIDSRWTKDNTHLENHEMRSDVTHCGAQVVRTNFVSYFLKCFSTIHAPMTFWASLCL